MPWAFTEFIIFNRLSFLIASVGRQSFPFLKTADAFLTIQWIESILLYIKELNFDLSRCLSFWEYFMLMSSSRTLNVPIFFAQKQKNLDVLICHPIGMGKNLLLVSLYPLRRNCWNTFSKPLFFYICWPKKGIYLCCMYSYIYKALIL